MRYLLIAILISFSVSAVYSQSKYSIVIDAGSTGSRIFIFELNKEGPKQSGLFKEKNAGGIHDASKDLSKLSAYLDPLIIFAKKELLDQASETPVYFRATGGMRLLQPIEQQQVLKGIKNYFKKSGFKSVSADTVSGPTEGIYAWIAANFALKRLSQENKSETCGTLDMGGVSTQITFSPLMTPEKHGYRLKLGKNSFDLYSYSDSELGLYTAIKSFKDPSCFNHGFKKNLDSHGSLSSCKRTISTALSLREVYQPELRGDFVALEGFARLTKIFPLSDFSSPTLDLLGEQLCPMKWSTVQAQYQERDSSEILAAGCFATAYYSALLTNYGFTPTSGQISTLEKIDHQDVSIALGVAVYENWGGKISPINPVD